MARVLHRLIHEDRLRAGPLDASKGKPMTHSTVRAAFALCLLLAISGACSATPSIGTQAPDFTVNAMDGGKFTLSNCWAGSGKVVVLDFWATWCNPCKAAIPSLISISSDYADKGVVVVGVSIEVPDTTPYNYAKEQGVNYTICNDPGFTATPAYNGAVPQLFIIDRTGVVRFHDSTYDPNNFDTQIRGALDQLTVPEPSSMVAILSGLVGCGGFALRRRRS
jgi:thiol-disulfide isomerase/thioredoxin